TEGLSFQTGELLFQTEELSFQTEGLLFQTEGLSFQTEGLLFQTEGLLFQTEELLFLTEGLLFQTGELLFQTSVVLFQKKCIRDAYGGKNGGVPASPRAATFEILRPLAFSGTVGKTWTLLPARTRALRSHQRQKSGHPLRNEAERPPSQR